MYGSTLQWIAMYCSEEHYTGGKKYCNIVNCDERQCRTWFQYKGNKQFGFEKSEFKAKFDSNGHRNMDFSSSSEI